MKLHRNGAVGFIDWLGLPVRTTFYGYLAT